MVEVNNDEAIGMLKNSCKLRNQIFFFTSYPTTTFYPTSSSDNDLFQKCEKKDCFLKRFCRENSSERDDDKITKTCVTRSMKLMLFNSILNRHTRLCSETCTQIETAVKKHKNSMPVEIELVVLKIWSSNFAKDPDLIAILKKSRLQNSLWNKFVL